MKFNYSEYDATALADFIRKGELSPFELLENVISKIENVNPQINAVIDRYYETAKSKLANIDYSSRFCGVPFLIKDMLEIKGIKTTMGSRLLADNIAKHTNVLTERIEQAGLIITASTNMSEFGLLPTTEPHLYGATKNPWNTDYSPGGSSGGSAAAVAAGIVPMAHAADGGGSIRIPASACGIFGLKPSRGRMPGNFTDSPDGFVQHFVISRSVRDSAAMLDLLSGNLPGDRWCLPAPVINYRDIIKTKSHKLRIGFMTKNFSENEIHKDCSQAVIKTALLCERLGHDVEEAYPHIDGKDFNEAFKVIWFSGVGYIYRLAQQHFMAQDSVPPVIKKIISNKKLFYKILSFASKDGHKLLEPFTKKMAGVELKIGPGDVWFAGNSLRKAEYKFAEFFGKYDLLLTPTLSRPPLKTGEFNHKWSIEETEKFLYDYVGFTPIANSAGFPAMSVPLSFSQNNLPVGSQFIANTGQEDILLQLAADLERESPWFNKIPLLN